MRAEEWSGPCPSYPCGNSITTPERSFHFWKEEETNSSVTAWPQFAKSPNWASHSTKVSGDSTE